MGRGGAVSASLFKGRKGEKQLLEQEIEAGLRECAFRMEGLSLIVGAGR